MSWTNKGLNTINMYLLCGIAQIYNQFLQFYILIITVKLWDPTLWIHF